MTAVSATYFDSRGITMNRLSACVFVLTLVGFPSVLVGAQGIYPRIDRQLHEKTDKKEKKAKGAPETGDDATGGCGRRSILYWTQDAEADPSIDIRRMQSPVREDVGSGLIVRSNRRPIM